MNRRTVHGETSCFFSGLKRAQPGGCVWCLLSGLGISVIEVLTERCRQNMAMPGALCQACWCSYHCSTPDLSIPIQWGPQSGDGMWGRGWGDEGALNWVGQGRTGLSGYSDQHPVCCPGEGQWGCRVPGTRPEPSLMHPHYRQQYHGGCASAPHSPWSCVYKKSCPLVLNGA